MILLLHQIIFCESDVTLKIILKIITTIDDKSGDGKLQYDFNGEVAKIPALSSGKINKYEYFTGEEKLPSNQSELIEQTKFIYNRDSFRKTNKSN